MVIVNIHLEDHLIDSFKLNIIIFNFGNKEKVTKYQILFMNIITQMQKENMKKMITKMKKKVNMNNNRKKLVCKWWIVSEY